MTHVRSQEWKAIAIGFLIVEVGVFIGIQVSNRNDERISDRSCLVDIERMREDPQASQGLALRLGRDSCGELIPVGANDTIADVAVRNRLANSYRGIEARGRCARRFQSRRRRSLTATGVGNFITTMDEEPIKVTTVATLMRMIASAPMPGMPTAR